jgi:hypothetical protein
MPREQITHNPIVDRPLVGPDYPAGNPGEHLQAVVHVEMPRRNVHVAWNRAAAGWVQIGIDVTVEELRGMLAAAVAEAEAEARKQEHIGTLDTENWQFRIVSDVLDRAEVNQTIATLRRARDTAYGKDA